MEEKKTANRYGRRAFRIICVSLALMFVVGVSSAVIFSRFRSKLSYLEETESVSYDGHYVFIASNDDDEFWREVYESACDEAEENNVYIENLEDSLGVNYSDTDLLRVAVNSGVDGIIYGGTADETAAQYIDRAVSEGIGVVLLQDDIEASARQCFVGVNNYELGQMYASQIAELARTMNVPRQMRVYILVNKTMNEGSTNVITVAIEDYLSEKLPDLPLPELEVIRINTEDTFSVEEDVRRIFYREEDLPDVVLCLNSIYTQCVYQALVDQNRVGDVSVIGYFANKSILEAIEKQIIYSTISMDTEEMGRDCVQALKEYTDAGYTNSYIAVSTQVIGKRQAERLLNEEE